MHQTEGCSVSGKKDEITCSIVVCRFLLSFIAMLHMIMVIVYLYDDGSDGRKNEHTHAGNKCTIVSVCVSSRDQQNVIEICVCLCAQIYVYAFLSPFPLTAFYSLYCC